MAMEAPMISRMECRHTKQDIYAANLSNQLKCVVCILEENVDLKAQLAKAMASLKDSTEHLIDNVKRQVKDAARIRELESKLADVEQAKAVWMANFDSMVQSNAALGREIQAMRGQRELARKFLQIFIDGGELEHEDPECPCDETCTCVNIKEINSIFREVQSPPSDQSSKMTGVEEALDRLLKALDRFGKNYGEFGTITGGEFLDDLFVAESNYWKVRVLKSDGRNGLYG